DLYINKALRPVLATDSTSYGSNFTFKIFHYTITSTTSFKETQLDLNVSVAVLSLCVMLKPSAT
ncbi:MAG: hypothetical protein WBY28_13130, partial [Nitrososphaeraceae archaeon]